MIKSLIYKISPRVLQFCVNAKHYLKYGSYGPYNKWSTKSLLKFIMDCYEKNLGYRFDINHPKTFTEKIQWYKLFFSHPDISNITDKVTFKSYITEQLGEGYVIKMFGAWDNITDMERDWNTPGKLPNTFILKANMQSMGLNIKVIKDKQSVDFIQIKDSMAEWLKPENTLINSDVTRFYRNKPMILAEEYLENVADQLYDYKFFCFDGVPFCIYVAQDHFGKDGSHISFYDLDWNKLDVQYGNHIVGDAEKPKHFDEMVEIAKKLSAGFPFLRVDFFDTDEKLYMAELTFNPGGGFTPYKPQDFNNEMGNLFHIPTTK